MALKTIARLWGSRGGASAFEYALLAALIAIASAGAIADLSSTLTGKFQAFGVAIGSLE